MKRLLSLLTAAALVLSLVPAEALAAETGACEHHTQHDANCGYSEAVPESPCTHVHTQECYSSATQCVHAHTEQCYSDGVLPAEGEEKTADACAHVCSADTGCITTALDCNHQHDETCGYAPATAGTPCGFVCETCSAAANESAQCTCESKCAEGAVNGECPVCVADLTACTVQEAQQNGNPPAEPEEPVCNCTAKCAEGAASGECPVCAPDPSGCTGKAPEAPVCTCTTKCVEGSVNPDCPVCGVEGADLTACAGPESTEKEADEAVAAVQAAVDALPTAEELTAMPQEEQQAVYTDLYAAYDAYQALTEEQKVQISGAEKFDALFEVFNAMVAPLTAAQLTSLIVDGTTVVENSTVGSTTSGTGWTYDVDSNTLTLKDATINGTDTIGHVGTGIYAEGDLTIVLVGSSTVTGVQDPNGDSQSIRVSGNLTIQGGGSLTAQGAETSSGSSYGIFVIGSFTQQGGSVTAIGGNINGNHTSTGLYVYGGTVTAQDGTLTATGGDTSGSSYGISMSSSSSVTVGSATVTVTGGTGNYSYGLYVNPSSPSVSPSVTLSGSGSLTARSGSGTDTAVGIYLNNIWSSTGSVTVGDNSTLLTNSVILYDHSFEAKPLAPTGDGSWLIYGQSDQTSAVGGTYTLTDDLTIENGNTFTIPAGSTLTVPQGKTLTVDGTLNIANQSSLTGNGSLAGSGAFNLTNPDPVISGDTALTYDGTDHFTDFSLTAPTGTMKVMGKDFAISGSASTEGWTLDKLEIKDAGIYTLTASNGTTTIEKEITVSPATISIASATVQDKTYDGNQDATVTGVEFTGLVNSESLSLGTDYTATATFADKNAGDSKQATVTVTLKNGNYSFAQSGNTTNANGTIRPLPVVLNWGTTSFTYDGSEKTVTAKVSNAVDGDTFTLTYEGNTGTAVGNYTAKVTDLGNDNYTLTGATGVELTWSIGGASIAGAAVDLSETEFTYTGQSQKPTVTVKLNGNTLNANTDYTVTYDGDTTNAGTVTVKVSGKGNYAGTTSKTFTIAKAPLTITGVDVQSKTYDGTTAATVTGVSFKGLVNGEALAMGTDYTATADFDDASADTFKSVTGKVTLLSSTLGKNYVLSDASFLTSGDISAAASKLSFKVDRTKPVKGQYITFSVTPQIKGDNRSFLQRVLGINAPKVEFWANGTTKLGEVKVEEGKTSTFAYDTDKGGLKLGKNTITAEFTGDGNLKGCTESVVVYLHDSTTSAPTGDTSNIQTWTVVLAVSAVVLIGLGVGAVIYRKKKK